MIAQSATLASARGAKVAVSMPERRPQRRDDPEIGREQELPNRADRDRRQDEGREEREHEERPASLHVGHEEGERQPDTDLQRDRNAREQDRVQEAAMEDRVAEDRPGVVLQPDEGRDRRSPSCHAR